MCMWSEVALFLRMDWGMFSYTHLRPSRLLCLLTCDGNHIALVTTNLSVALCSFHVSEHELK